jgi:hypothetical protein
MQAVMRSEARFRPQHRGTRDAVLEQKRKYFAAQEVAARTRILIQMNGDLFCRTKSEHAHSIPFATVPFIPKNAENSTEDFLKFS